jgi:ankyrin repeat protein
MCGKDIPVDLFKIILEKSTDINAQDKDGDTALHLAISCESETEKVEVLLAHKDVNVNIKNNFNRTPLQLASKWKDIPSDLFKLILEKSTDINAKDNNGETALHWAIIHLSGTATKELLAHKDVDVKRKLKRKF